MHDFIPSTQPSPHPSNPVLLFSCGHLGRSNADVNAIGMTVPSLIGERSRRMSGLTCVRSIRRLRRDRTLSLLHRSYGPVTVRQQSTSSERLHYVRCRRLGVDGTLSALITADGDLCAPWKCHFHLASSDRCRYQRRSFHSLDGATVKHHFKQASK